MSPADLDRSEIMMYLGTPALDAKLSLMLEDCIQAVCDAAQPRTIFRVLPVEHTESGVVLGGLPLLGDDIALHLSGCEQAALFAVTLSTAVDAVIRRAEVTDMTRAVMLDAAAGAAVERVCCDLEKQIKSQYPYSYYTERFSVRLLPCWMLRAKSV